MRIAVFILSLLLLVLMLSAHSQATQTTEAKVGAFIGNINIKHPQWFKESFLDFGEDIDEATAEGKRLVLYFWQAGCPYCNRLWEHNMSVDGVEESFQSQFDVVAINIWGDQEVVTVGGKQFTEKQLARALDVDYTPTLQFYDENKKQVLRLNGYLPPERFKIALSYASGNNHQEQSFNEFVQGKMQREAGLARSEVFFQIPGKGLLNRSKKPALKPLAVLFETPNCKSCERFHDVTLQNEVTRQLLEAMDVVQLNALSDEVITKPDGEAVTARKWANELGLNYYPSIAFFDEKGEQIMLMSSYLRNFHTQSVFAYVQEKAYQQQPSFQRYLSARADHFIEQGIDVDIWLE